MHNTDSLSQNSDEVDDNADKGQPHGAEVEYAHQRHTLIKFVCTENAEQQAQPKRDPLVAKLSACYGSVAIGVCVDIAVGVVYHDLRLLMLLLISSTCGPQEVEMTASAAIIDPQCL